jgi:hypothetical protein
MHNNRSNNDNNNNANLHYYTVHTVRVQYSKTQHKIDNLKLQTRLIARNENVLLLVLFITRSIIS